MSTVITSQGDPINARYFGMAWIYPPSNGAENTFLVQYPMLIKILIQKVILKAYTDSDTINPEGDSESLYRF